MRMGVHAVGCKITLDTERQLFTIDTMKRFLIPAFFVVDGDDNLTEQEAERRVVLMQTKANEEGRMLLLGSYLMLDEELPTREVQIHPDETELPGTYKSTVPACTDDFRVGQTVKVTRIDGSPFDFNFIGTITEINAEYVVVRNHHGVQFSVNPTQLSSF